MIDGRWLVRDGDELEQNVVPTTSALAERPPAWVPPAMTLERFKSFHGNIQ